MSASNWTMCPNCVRYAEENKIKFLDKYKDKIESFILAKLIKAIDKKIEWLKSYSDDAFEQDEDVIELIQDSDWTVDDDIYSSENESSCRVREDYEQGLNKDGTAYCIYEGDCQYCDLYRQIRVDNISNEYKHDGKKK